MTRRIGRWIGLSSVVLVSAYITTVAVFYATGRGGSAPCGEDSWRWGFMHLFVWVPAFLASTAVGTGGVLALRGRVQLWFLIGLVVLLQLGAAFVTLVALQWPQIVYYAPVCE